LARVKGEEGWELVMWGRDGTASHGLYVRNDSKVGSIQELKGSTLVHPGWDTGTTQLAQILFRHWWGLELGKDFRLVSVPWEVGPKMVAEGGAVGGLSLMPYTLSLWRDRAIRPLLISYGEEWAKRRGTGHHLAMSLWVSWGGGLERHEGAARALLGAWAEGMAYAYTRTGEWSKKYLVLTLPGAGDGEVRFFAEWFGKYQPTYRTPYLDETFIREEEAFLDLALKANVIKSRGLQGNWRIIKPE
jgi:ABC-type nitrate/sulfonate/bicarbonate transport system substrate-binding protein